MEGSTAQFYMAEDVEKYKSGETTIEDIVPIMELHSLFSNYSGQDASTTYEHTLKLLQYLQSTKVLSRGSTLSNDTDGCGKQYRCGTFNLI
jgi:hypothetical protein